MPKTITVQKVTCNTVGDLLDQLAALAKNPATSDLMDASIESTNGNVFTGFRVLTRELSDGSEVMDFELFED